MILYLQQASPKQYMIPKPALGALLKQKKMACAASSVRSNLKGSTEVGVSKLYEVFCAFGYQQEAVPTVPCVLATAPVPTFLLCRPNPASVPSSRIEVA